MLPQEQMEAHQLRSVSHPLGTASRLTPQVAQTLLAAASSCKSGQTSDFCCYVLCCTAFHLQDTHAIHTFDVRVSAVALAGLTSLERGSVVQRVLFQCFDG